MDTTSLWAAFPRLHVPLDAATGAGEVCLVRVIVVEVAIEEVLVVLVWTIAITTSLV